HPEPETLTTALATLHTNGHTTTLHTPHTPTHHLDLPTYPFQRDRYWMAVPPRPAVGDLAAAGVTSVGHPLLAAVTELPETDTTVWTGTLSAPALPWLADHLVWDRGVAPGTAVLEIVLQIGERIGLPRISELVLEAPLSWGADAPTVVRTVVGALSPEGTREVSLYSRPEDEAVWTRHASGRLAPAGSEEIGSGVFTELSGVWPPPGAQEVDVSGQYELFAAAGVGYGGAFRGLRAVWRREDEIFAEVRLPDDHATDAAGYGLHPALLDAALHPIALLDPLGDGGHGVLPFVWTDVLRPRSGGHTLRVRVARAQDPTDSGQAERPGGAVSLAAADRDGVPVFVARSLVLRRVSATQLPAAPSVPLHRLGWVPIPGFTEPIGAGGSDPSVLDLTEPAADVHRTVREVLEAVQTHLREPAGDGPRLVVLTRGAAGPEGGADDPAGAAAWGLVRSAQSEHPGRFVLIDVDDTAESSRALPAVVAAVGDVDAPQVAVRQGRPSVPRLVPLTADRTEAEPGGPGHAGLLDPDGTVLISGGTGALAAVTARHLVARHGVRHLLLVSRRGMEAPQAAELASELDGLGADVEFRACDVTDRAAVHRLLAGIPAERPLSCVVHTAGVLDDGVISAQTSERVAAVLGPKADGALHFDELTRDRERPVLLLLFSSVSGVLGSTGQAGYAAANAFLDALAARRRADGHPALSLGWGWWTGTGMAAGLDRADTARIRRSGVAPLDAVTAMDLFDRALSRPEPALLPVRLDHAALREAARAGTLPEVLRDLADAPSRAHPAPVSEGITSSTGTGSGLAERLARRAASERLPLLLELVRTEVAAVLGHGDPGAVSAERSFKDAGFDSLTAVDLRNRLNARTGLRLPATLVFDHPTPLALAELLLAELDVEPATDGTEDLAAAFDRLARGLAALDDRAARVGAAERLRSLLTALTSSDPDPGTGAQAGLEADGAVTEVVTDRLRSASDDELFDLYDSEFR
ncbi:SDR family NAD(P)-dependent oxidoreductase, partial [Streptomyces djakartensis]|uniref:SDR family NAD(P)-dependent oxidoreductase n=1 Tax=Streptomyces djakartensis TaxID=68193 RepID=UPI00167CEBEA